MSNMDKYQSGRMDGLLMAQRIVRDGGAEAAGRLAELPCAVNDTIYALVSTKSGYIVKKMQVKEIQLKHRPFGDAVILLEQVDRRGILWKYYETDFGKVAFYTQEDAEMGAGEDSGLTGSDNHAQGGGRML